MLSWLFKKAIARCLFRAMYGSAHFLHIANNKCYVFHTGKWYPIVSIFLIYIWIWPFHVKGLALPGQLFHLKSSRYFSFLQRAMTVLFAFNYVPPLVSSSRRKTSCFINLMFSLAIWHWRKRKGKKEMSSIVLSVGQLKVKTDLLNLKRK